MANFSKPQSMVTMLFALFALLQVTVASQHGSHHHAHRNVVQNNEIKTHIDEVQEALEKRQSGQFIATSGVCSTGTVRSGVCNSNGRQSYPRQEIRTLRRNEDQWNLYLLGMERFQSKSKDDVLSYYQIAGVHGRPFTTWNKFPTPLMHDAGFCPHGSTLFGSWHRPYLAIYEQAWYLAVTEVIATFPSNQQQRWRNAAQTLRMPYWDWAMDPGQGQPTVPTFVREQRITVTKPQGRVEIANPLYSYSWGSSMPQEMGGGPWNSFPQTLRRPVSNPTRSNNNEMNARFDNMRVSLRDRLFALFSSKQSWGFASTSQIGVRTDLSGSGTDSFESVHDSIHNAAGGETGGHMYYLDMSAFDPLFWVHHTNVDRLLNMYQYIVPRTYVANGNIPRGMAQWNEGEPKNSYTPLKPFTKSTNGDYFTSEEVRDTRVFGYYYPETSDRSYQQVAQAVTRLYGAGVRQLTKRGLLKDVVGDATNVVGDVVDTVKDIVGGVTDTVGAVVDGVTDTVGDVVDGVTDIVDEATEVVDDLVNGIGQFLGRPLKEGDYYHVLDITADKFAMDGSYTVHCFIGNGNGNGTSNSTAPYGNSTAPAYKPQSTGSPYPTKNHTGEVLEDYDPSKDFTNDPNYVGAYGILGGMKAGGGNASYPLITRGSLPLTSCLQGKEHYGYLKSLKPEHVEPYLAANMYYKVIGQNGELDPTTIPNFHVAAKCTKVIPASSPDELPDLSAPYEILHKATEKLPAGLPYVYKISPIDFVAPDASYEEDGKYNVGYPPNDNGGNYQSPGLGDGIFGEVPKWSETGYCPVVKTIKYVYPDGREAHY